jgi:hypothetical protein
VLGPAELRFEICDAVAAALIPAYGVPAADRWLAAVAGAADWWQLVDRMTEAQTRHQPRCSRCQGGFNPGCERAVRINHICGAAQDAIAGRVQKLVHRALGLGLDAQTTRVGVMLTLVADDPDVHRIHDAWEAAGLVLDDDAPTVGER